jgi:hypothetical protein
VEHAVTPHPDPVEVHSAPELIVRIEAYWRELGLKDPILIESLSHDCLHRARRLIGRPDDGELLRRALEEAQRRFDHALANAMGMPPSNDPQPLAAARAALLLSPEWSGDTLFRHDETTRQLAEQLRSAIPVSVPPESHLTMKTVPLDFWLFKSTDR